MKLLTAILLSLTVLTFSHVTFAAGVVFSGTVTSVDAPIDTFITTGDTYHVITQIEIDETTQTGTMTDGTIQVSNRGVGIQSNAIRYNTSMGHIEIVPINPITIGTIPLESINFDYTQTENTNPLNFSQFINSIDSGTFSIQVLGGNNIIEGTIENIKVNPVPIPAAFWLFGSAIAGLVLARKKVNV
jgi:hypothetical protein